MATKNSHGAEVWSLRRHCDATFQLITEARTDLEAGNLARAKDQLYQAHRRAATARDASAALEKALQGEKP